jgi:parallel beta-helix repeat protein
MAALALLVPVCLAADGAIPVWQPVQIDQPGKYQLTRDVSGINNPIIEITAGNVHLDLNGFTVEGSAGAFLQDVILVDGADNVTIENGTVIGGGAGIRLSTATQEFNLRNLSIRGGRTGIAASASGTRGMIEGNLIENISAEGILASGSSVQVRNNVISAEGTGIKAVNCEACLISENTVRDALDAGVLVESSNGALLMENTVAGAGDGIRITSGGSHHVEGNVLTGNNSYGLYLTGTASDCVYRRNTARNNAGSGCAGTGNADYCDNGTANTSHGDNYMPSLL